jgi:D-serine deaminase-like pyridoxal phosphate-dependent protein
MIHRGLSIALHPTWPYNRPTDTDTDARKTVTMSGGNDMEMYNTYLPGTPKEDLDTPALLIDLDVMERNIETAAAFFRGVEADLRPHTKTNKSPVIAKKQIEAGAIGICCAKVGEAEQMVDGGIDDILIPNQVVGRAKIIRLMSLAKRAKMKAAVDDPQNVNDLSEAAQAFGAERGVEPGEPTVELAKVIAGAKGLKFMGIMGYEGHMVNTTPDEARVEGTHKAMALLLETRDALENAGLPVEVVSAGGTGTYSITGKIPGITEIEAGSYVFMDGSYRKVLQDFQCALTVLTTVISRPTPDRAVVDIGRKSISNDMGMPDVFNVEGATLTALSEEHGKLQVEGDARQLRPGDKIEILPSHGDTTINIHSHYFGVRNGKLEAIWEIAGRGKFR